MLLGELYSLHVWRNDCLSECRRNGLGIKSAMASRMDLINFEIESRKMNMS